MLWMTWGLGALASVASWTPAPESSVVALLGYDATGHPLAAGTGFVAGEKGLVLSSGRLIRSTPLWEASTPDGRSIPVAEVLGFDESGEVALLRLSAADLPVLELGDASAVAEGATVFAVALVPGFEQVITEGQLDRRESANGRLLLLTTIVPSPGAEGGPLLDDQGRVIGVLVTADERQPLGWAVPIDGVRVRLHSRRAPSK